MQKPIYLKTLILSICCASLVLGGCTSKETASNISNTRNSQFDALTREMFVDFAASDTLTLNYTLKDPSAYDIEPGEVSWGAIPVTEEDFEAYKEDTADYLERLNSMTDLNDEQVLTYDVLKYYLELDLESYDYVYFTTNFAPMLGVQSQLPITMAEYPFDDLQDVEDYLTLLTSLEEYVSQLLLFENAKAAAGYGMCASALSQAIEECEAFCDTIDTNMLIEVFPSRLDAFDLTDDEKEAYIQANENAIKNHVIPTYHQIIDALSAQLATAPAEGNLASYVNGKDYYEYLLKASVGTDKTADELIALTEENIYSCFMGLSLLLMNNQTIFDEIEHVTYALTDPKEIIEHFKETLTNEYFPEAPEANYTLKNVHESMSDSLSPAMYFIPRVDDISNNQIYLNLGGNSSSNELMPTLAHEGYPGHMYQMTYYYSTQPDPIRTVYDCDGYMEGWASYAESLSYDYCGFSEDVADFNRIFNSTLSLNLYCRLDLGVHYENWSLEEMSDYVNQYLDLPEETTVELYDAILYNPTNYLIYGIGMEEICELRDQMKENLGEAFDLQDFHKQLLDIGPAPFSIIEKYMPDAAQPLEVPEKDNL